MRERSEEIDNVELESTLGDVAGNYVELQRERHRSIRTPADRKAFNEALEKGDSIEKAMLAAGYAPGQARKGRSALSKALQDDLLAFESRHFTRLAEFGKTVNPDQIRNAIMGGLAKNLGERTDKGFNTMKLAGSLRELNLFTPDTQVGVIVIGELPKTMEALANEALPENTIAGELPDTSKL